MAIRRLEMCVINTDLVDELAHLIGSQATIMRRAGISWNSWLKIRAGQPVLMSVGKRLRARILDNADTFERFGPRFQCGKALGGFDRAAFEANFLRERPIACEGEPSAEKCRESRKIHSLEPHAH